MKIFFASGNKHKRDELSRILAPHTIVIPSDEGMEFDPDETETTFFGNAMIKAKALYALVNLPVIADDSGICVDALGGSPGVLSARYGSEKGRNLDSAEKNALLLSQMEGQSNRTCRFVCAMVLYVGPEHFFAVQETLEGELASTSTGTLGFGYDPIVYLPEYKKTVAELTAEEKDAYSHRGKAGMRLKKIMESF